MIKLVRTGLLMCIVALSAQLAQAQDVTQDVYALHIREYIESEVKSWLADPLIITSIKDQNQRNKDLQAADIQSLDQKWRFQSKQTEKPFIEAILDTDLSKFLAARQDESDGLLLEIFVMDAKGLNVGQSRETSDYWQGDEAKWINTYTKGSDVLFIDDVDIDESTGTFQTQASLSIADPDTGNVIGAITLGFNFEIL